MFIVQTYFSNEISGRAKAFAYYVELPGNSVDFRDRVQKSFRELGDEYGPSVSLFFPDVGSVSKMREEIRRELATLFDIRGKEMPGIIISPALIGNTSGRDDWIYIGLRDRPTITIQEISGVVRDSIEAIKASGSPPEPTVISRLWSALEAKPGVGGFRLDLKKLFKSPARL